jgi:hypothetical protein
MKRIASIMLGLSLTFGGIAFAQEKGDPPKTEKKKVETKAKAEAKGKAAEAKGKVEKGKVGAKGKGSQAEQPGLTGPRGTAEPKQQ